MTRRMDVSSAWRRIKSPEYPVLNVEDLECTFVVHTVLLNVLLVEKMSTSVRNPLETLSSS